MAEDTGATSYYNPIPASAGRLASVSVPIAGIAATVAYGDDDLGWVVVLKNTGTQAPMSSTATTMTGPASHSGMTLIGTTTHRSTQ